MPIARTVCCPTGIRIPAAVLFTLLLTTYRLPAQTLESISGRLPGIEQRLPVVIQAAEQAAKLTLQNTNLLVNVPYSPQPSFAEEMVNRSGCLANALPSEERTKHATPEDVLLFSVRSWEDNGADAIKRLTAYRSNHACIVLFASKAGMPDNVPCDYLVDNGAPDGSRTHASANAILNVLNGLLWQCEYTAALTRHGVYPGILQSILEPGANEHNATLQKPELRRSLFRTPGSIPPGQLARQFMGNVHTLVLAIRQPPVHDAIREAANQLATHIKAGKGVKVATATHILMYEVFHDHRSPWKPFNVVWHASTAFKENLKPDDLLIWFSFVGMSTPLEDYGRFIRETGVECITSFVQDENPANNEARKRVHIPMSWARPDTVVEIPFPPGRMAPVSGLNQGIVYRCLDDAVFEALATP